MFIATSNLGSTSNPVCQDGITISTNTYSERNDNSYDLCFLIKLYCSFIDRKYTRCNEDCILHSIDTALINYHLFSGEILNPTIVVLGSIVVSIPACHAGDRGSIPRRGGICFFTILFFLPCFSRN